MKGGVDPNIIREEDFKYTLSAQRKEWTKNSYNAGVFLIGIIKSIPWDKYILMENLKCVSYKRMILHI